MSGFEVLASKLGAKVTLGNMGDVVYPPVPPSPAPSEEWEPGAEMAHIYTPLKHDEIRLLVLNPGSGDEPISCFLEDYPVVKPKAFAALSYVWGLDTPGTRRRILLNGCPVDVTANLYAFLSSHRTEDACSVLWVDAVCINQDDLVERGAQIHLMKRVYESAEQVLIWLGESSPSMDAAITRILDIYESWWTPILRRTGSAHRSLTTITDEDIGRLLDGATDDGLTGDIWRAGLQEILSRPWWSRIWVYQEATAPCKSGAEVIIGPHHMPFDALLTVHQVMRSIALRGHPDPLFSLGWNTNSAVHPAAYMQTYAALRKRHQTTGRSRFLRLPDLLSALRRFEATNPRDKLYALIPTSLDGAELLDVAFDQPVEQVYAQAAWSMIRTYRNLDVLGHCIAPSASPNEHPLLELPSWVPDWTAEFTAIPFFKRGLAAHLPSAPKDADAYGVHIDDANVEIGKMYHASGNNVADASVDPTGMVLSCTGFIFDRVANVSPEAGSDILGNEVNQAWMAWLREISTVAFQDISKNTFSRILVAECDRVAVDVGMRRRGETASAGAHSSSSSKGYHMDITGPHPASFRRRLIVTGKGCVGLTAEHVQPGDLVTIMMGAQMPMILREAEQNFVFIGEAFIDGIMDGEALAGREQGENNVVFTIQ